MHVLTGRIRDYAWGSRTALAELTGRPAPTPGPEAELWLGAHEAAPALTAGGTLAELIAEDPQAALGIQTAQRFANRLPFLLKVLAPERALSIQCHPDATQALDAVPGTYTDRSPKPEAVVPLTPLEAFEGMVSFPQICERLGSLDIPELQAVLRDADGAHGVLAGILAVPAELRADVVARTLAALDRPNAVPQPEADAVRRVAQDYPGDIGLIVLLTMHHCVVEPGSYLFVPAGLLHAYVRGVTIEILANSDNVVRAGLTPKKIDVAELLRIVVVHQRMVAEPGHRDGRVVHFPVSTPQFRLLRVDPGSEPVDVDVAGPRIVLAIDGPVEVSCDGQSERLESGDAVFASDAEGSLWISGPGTAYLAALGVD